MQAIVAMKLQNIPSDFIARIDLLNVCLFKYFFNRKVLKSKLKKRKQFFRQNLITSGKLLIVKEF